MFLSFGTRIAPLIPWGTGGTNNGEKGGGTKIAVDIGSGFMVSIKGSVSAAIAAGGQIAELESEIRVLRKGDRL
jgi:hypothetical protein